MENRMFDPPEGQQFVVSVSPQWVIEEALLESDEPTVRERAARCFRAMNPLVKYDQTEVTLTQAGEEAERELKRLTRDLHAIDAVETTVSAEIATKPHWMTRVAGMATAGLCIALLAPLPIVVALAVNESLLIDYVIEYPVLGAMYGLAPLGGVICLHGLRDTLKSDRAQTWFDRAVYGLTAAAALNWAATFGPVFLTDPLAGGFGAAAPDKATLASWYLNHLALEMAAGASCYLSATHLLTRGARKVAKVSETKQALHGAIVEETDAQVTLAERRDQLASAPHHHQAALEAFQDRCAVKVAVVQKIIAAKQAADGLASLAELKTALQDLTFEETDDA